MSPWSIPSILSTLYLDEKCVLGARNCLVINTSNQITHHQINESDPARNFNNNATLCFDDNRLDSLIRNDLISIYSSGHIHANNLMMPPPSSSSHCRTQWQNQWCGGCIVVGKIRNDDLMWHLVTAEHENLEPCPDWNEPLLSSQLQLSVSLRCGSRVWLEWTKCTWWNEKTFVAGKWVLGPFWPHYFLHFSGTERPFTTANCLWVDARQSLGKPGESLQICSRDPLLWKKPSSTRARLETWEPTRMKAPLPCWLLISCGRGTGR